VVIVLQLHTRLQSNFSATLVYINKGLSHAWEPFFDIGLKVKTICYAICECTHVVSNVSKLDIWSLPLFWHLSDISAMCNFWHQLKF